MIVETDTRWGRWQVPMADLFVGWSLQAYGEFSPLEWRFLVSLLKPRDVVLDIGANLGGGGSELDQERVRKWRAENPALR